VQHEDLEIIHDLKLDIEEEACSKTTTHAPPETVILKTTLYCFLLLKMLCKTAMNRVESRIEIRTTTMWA
jgi:hypothetical protein